MRVDYKLKVKKKRTTDRSNAMVLNVFSSVCLVRERRGRGLSIHILASVLSLVRSCVIRWLLCFVIPVRYCDYHVQG